MCTAGFPEPLTFTLRAWQQLRARRPSSTSCTTTSRLGCGLLGLRRAGVPARRHHPPPDRHRPAPRARRRAELRRRLTAAPLVRLHRACRRGSPAGCPAHHRLRELAPRHRRPTWACRPEQLQVIPVGIDPDVFRRRPATAVPRPHRRRDASADVPLKGLGAPARGDGQAAHRARRASSSSSAPPDPGGPAERARPARPARRRPLLTGPCPRPSWPRCCSPPRSPCVPSLYEGFSLPAIEAMACAHAAGRHRRRRAARGGRADGHAGLRVPPATSGR